jgi:hypothetical protein
MFPQYHCEKQIRHSSSFIIQNQHLPQKIAQTCKTYSKTISHSHSTIFISRSLAFPLPLPFPFGKGGPCGADVFRSRTGPHQQWGYQQFLTIPSNN